MRYILFSYIFLLSTAFCLSHAEANNIYPRGYFSSPVKHDIELTGTFGELRPNHFHAGIDIRPRRSGVEEPVIAAADGWISRIQVQPSGYGNVLYIDHPNGFTTVYAHLERFTPEVDSFVKFLQYSEEKFELDFSPNTGLFRFAQGQDIGVMGNTGASQGLHLHFEIRRTGSDEALNPLLFGFPIADEKAPKFYELKIYHLDDENKTIGGREIYLREKARKRRVKKGKKWKTITIAPNPNAPYVIQNDTIAVSADRIGLGIKAYDSADWSGNTNGIFGLEMYRDGLPSYSFDTECFYFEDTRYINAHIDYTEKLSGGGYFNRCFSLPGNQLNIYKDKINNGVITLQTGQQSKIQFVARDIAGNRDTLQFWIKCTGNSVVKKGIQKNGARQLCYDEDNSFSHGNLKVHVPAGALYETADIHISESEIKSTLAFSPVYRIHNSATPLHRGIKLTIRPQRFVPDSLLGKVCIAYRDGRGNLTNCGKEWTQGDLSATAQSFGSFFIFADTVKPTIKPLRFQKDMQKVNRISFKVSDNMQLDKTMVWRAEVDGKWILMEFDLKSKTLVHFFDERTAPGEHVLKLMVKDKQGNEQIFVSSFIR